ncbi:MAG: hypothetical protein QOH44_123, partial [Actinomycetota bacterium]|nr:hypothetical protein [Actinomycetota bacterium]
MLGLVIGVAAVVFLSACGLGVSNSVDARIETIANNITVVPQAADLVAALRSRCDAELPRFKRPAQIVVLKDLPRAPTGKVQRSRVRSLAETGAM